LTLAVGGAIAIAPLVTPVLDYAGYYYTSLKSSSTKYLVANNSSGLLGYPKYRVANVKDIQNQSNCPVYFFAYPLTDEPCFLIDFNALNGEKNVSFQNPYYDKFRIQGFQQIQGVGPNKSICAFSAVCVHLGCQLPAQVLTSSPNNPGLNPQTTILHCPCHGSEYSLIEGGVVKAGPAPRPLPAILLEYDETTGDIYAVAANGPYFSEAVPRTTPQDNLLYDPRYSYSVPNNPSCSQG